MKKSELQLIREEISKVLREGSHQMSDSTIKSNIKMKHIQTFESFLNEARAIKKGDFVREEIQKLNEVRITYGKETIYNLNQDTPNQFAKQFSDDDIFFTNDGKAVVTNRMSNIISHGKDGNNMNINKVKFVYAGKEKEFYSVDNYKKVLKAIYKGKRASVQPLQPK